MPLFYLFAAVFAGAMLPTQAAMNGQLARALGGPIMAAIYTSAAVVLTLVVFNMVSGRAMPRAIELATIPWWAWLSGLCGAIFLTITSFAVSRIGAASLVALVIAGQIITAIMLDSFGLLGLPPQPLNGQRMLAAALIVAGGALMSTQ
jgi:bacterial/archaeal transporter family-2 protein